MAQSKPKNENLWRDLQSWHSQMLSVQSDSVSATLLRGVTECQKLLVHERHIILPSSQRVKLCIVLLSTQHPLFFPIVWYLEYGLVRQFSSKYRSVPNASKLREVDHKNEALSFVSNLNFIKFKKNFSSFFAGLLFCTKRFSNKHRWCNRVHEWMENG